MTTQTDENTKANALSEEEKHSLKNEIKKIWSKFPLEMREFIIAAKKEKLKGMYMIQDWAKKNDHRTISDLVSRKIEYLENHIEKMESDSDSDKQ